MKVIGIAGISLDGCMTKHDNEGISFLSKEDRKYFNDALLTFDCSLYGSKTFEAAKSHVLKTLTPNRLRVVLTSRSASFSQYVQKGVLEFKSGNICKILNELKRRHMKRCVVLGGSNVYTQCIKSKVMDELWVTLEPLGFGSGKRMFIGQVEFHFSLSSVEHLSQDTLLLKYKIK